ncbi:MAG: hypothetical protein JO160_01425 [Candidatus Eremiobacteraeota bacterium]|nr:hypothetical protein [Candidatus Eremiobacteraeota bacterium]
MRNVIVALSLALSLMPVAALADDQGPPGAPTDAQRQAMYQTFQTFHQKEEQLQRQFRAQVLGTLSPVHRSAVANVIGQLAISSNPNEQTAAAQIDALLSAGERQQIVNAHNAFRTQSKALHEQFKAAMKSEMPDHPMGPMGSHGGMMPMNHPQMQPDAGRIVLHVLGHSGEGESMHHMWGGPPPPPRR